MAGGEPRLGTTATYMRHNDHGTTHLSTEIDRLHDRINNEYRVFSSASVRKWSKFGLGHRFRDAPWQRTVRRGLIPVTVGIVIASSYVVARAADTEWQAAAITGATVALMLGTRINPLWILVTGGAIGGLGLL